MLICMYIYIYILIQLQDNGGCGRNNKTQDLARRWRCTDDSWSYGCVFDMFLDLKGPVKLGYRRKDKSREGANQNNHS